MRAVATIVSATSFLFHSFVARTVTAMHIGEAVACYFGPHMRGDKGRSLLNIIGVYE